MLIILSTSCIAYKLDRLITFYNSFLLFFVAMRQYNVIIHCLLFLVAILLPQSSANRLCSCNSFIMLDCSIIGSSVNCLSKQ